MFQTDLNCKGYIKKKLRTLICILNPFAKHQLPVAQNQNIPSACPKETLPSATFVEQKGNNPELPKHRTLHLEP